ncbi:DNA polymerase exonuclease subunit [Mycobacterium phage BarrelRoll]|uniref:DnaE-like DNA polymerase III n=1 Tax=Mycobacterium phage BarrelRoll TaxID=1084722 RepID=G3MCK7_9CAUD|nr:DNA polymerase exonuclease subunit [Mycobacterium phage BarrelRoll]AEO94196.1 DnaE-like DNA polymerase III [Mycobacterium phage BarrelRoll]ASR87570.1 DnaE-like DNA polymerase III [Mycobacterium phage Slimphazie]QFG14610.1 DnaE-like DNA polymerase III [Mycobacterium phage Rapunzel97]WNM73548.1 DnaE-like DNA polymerase III alpha [Mycobacterium Phage TruffulaTree]
MARKLIVVDLETTSLDYDTAAPLEVALLNVDTGESLRFVPHVTCEQLGAADPKAMEINGYYERGVWREALTEQQTAVAWSEVKDWLRGNTFAGSNPAFDSTIVARQAAGGMFPAPIGRVWHHRLADLAAYSAGKLDRDPTELAGLDDVAERLGVQVAQRHTAIGDAAATGLCFDLLRNTKAAAL